MDKVKHTFFCQTPESGQLSPEESHHAIKVMRMKEGDSFEIIDGKGLIGLAKVTEANAKSLQFELVQSSQINPSEIKIHLLIAPPKSKDRISFLLEKLSEIGCHTIQPIRTQNSERKETNTEKLSKNLVAAIKQSSNPFLPELKDMVSLSEALGQFDHIQDKFISHCREDDSKKHLKEFTLSGKEVVILVGPEGDFTSEEIKLAVEGGFKTVSLGDNILRTETAGIVACHIANLYWS